MWRRQAESELARLAGEQAALRRVAMLVAREASQAEVVAAIADEIGGLLGTDELRILRYEYDGTAVVVASSAAGSDLFAVGSRHRLGGENATSRVFETRRPVRIDDLGGVSGPIGEGVRSIGMTSVVAAPITVEGRVWGAMLAATTRELPLPPETETRLAQFTELMATAIANTESHARADRLATEQAALRRVATLVAAGGAPDEIFTAVADEVRHLVGNDLTSMFRCDPGDMLTLVAVRSRGPVPDGLVGKTLPMRRSFSKFLQAGRPVRLDEHGTAQWMVDLAEAEPLDLKSAIGVPIVAGGRPWGAIFVCDTKVDGLPPGVERSFAQFSELVATAIANAQARAELNELAEEQAALRRVATLVAESVEPSAIFSAVSEEVGGLLDSDMAAVARFDPDGPAIVVVGLARGFEGVTIGSRFELDDSMATAAVYRTGRAARIDTLDWSAVTTPIGEVARRLRSVSSVSTPIVVEGRLWGTIALWATEPLPVHAEDRLEKFTALVATAIANAESREALRRLADEQAALRRVATLVARGATPTAVFGAVAAEIKGLLQADHIVVCRYEPGTELTVVAHRGSAAQEVPTGTRIDHAGDSVEDVVRRTERSARMETYEGAQGIIAELARAAGVRVAVGAPIVVEGRLWGVVSAGWNWEEPPPPETEQRMAEFAQLLDTAIANADSRDQLTASRVRLLTEADEARRRVVRDLHDGAQQRLVHAIVTLQLAQQALRESNGSGERLVGEALEYAQQGNTELRELAHGILPAGLTRAGLRSGIDAVVARLDLPVDIDMTSERFATEIEASAYFIVAEAMTNVVKHSHATRARVTARVQDGMLCLEIGDDGKGGADPHGRGLVGLADRATALGGRLEVESPVGGGTLLTATLQLGAT